MRGVLHATVAATVMLVLSGCSDPPPPERVTPTPPVPPAETTPPTPEVAVPEAVPTPEAPPGPGSGTIIAPHPLVLTGTEATLGRDPADPDAIVVTTPGCEVRVAELHPMAGDAPSGASTRGMLERIGATFTTSDVADDHWALSYSIAGHPSVQHGLVVDGHIYVCRGMYDAAEAQTCGAAACGALRPTGGSAAPTPSGPIVAHCMVGSTCNQVHEEVRSALDQSCTIVNAAVEPGPCPDSAAGNARLGVCVMPSGTDWVYYAGEGATRAAVETQCAQLAGAFRPG